MSRYDLLIRNGILVTPMDIQQCDMAIVEGRIVALEPQLSGTGDEEIDATGLHLFPGVIDAHVHLNEPGRTAWEGFATGTKAMAAGGTTTFFDMPLNASPPTLDPASFKRKLAAAQASSYIDFAFWGGLVPGNSGQLAALADCGVVGFKAFMSNSGISDFPAVDDLTLYEGMAQAAALGKIVAVHAENEQITRRLAQRACAQGRTGVKDFLASRPIIAEIEAIERALLFAGETGCALHIVHVSCGKGISMVAEARARGINVSCETCPHYLTLTEEDMERLGAVAKCAPPLRSAKEQEALWQYLQAGAIQFVASDHSPAPPEMKTASDFFQIWGGISGCQSLLQLLLTEGYEKRDVPLTSLVSLTTRNVAQRFGLPAHKGGLALGMDADVVLVDLQQSFPLRATDLFYRHQQSPYVGRTLRGRIMRTLLRGKTIYWNGTFASPPLGHLLTAEA